MNRMSPVSRSTVATWRLTAEAAMHSSAPAAVRLRCRAAASKTTSAFMGGRDRRKVTISKLYGIHRISLVCGLNASNISNKRHRKAFGAPCRMIDMHASMSLADLVDLERYPLTDDAAFAAIADSCRHQLRESSFACLPNSSMHACRSS